MQEALSECGWPEAANLCQQDASEAFTFVTEKLELPLLTLKMDIYHTGKEDVADDHKFINERLLEVAIPPEHEDGTAITLEECLEAYFNNKIEVKRYLQPSHQNASTDHYFPRLDSSLWFERLNASWSWRPEQVRRNGLNPQSCPYGRQQTAVTA